MKWKGREGSGNVEDRRGMSTGRMAVGGGIGTIVILLIVLLLGGDPDPVAVRPTVKVGNEGFGWVVVGGARRPVQHVDALKPGRSFQERDHRGRTPFAGAVVHHRDAGADGLDERRVVGEVGSVVVDQVQVHRPNETVGARELHLAVPGQVAHVEHAERAEGE